MNENETVGQKKISRKNKALFYTGLIILLAILFVVGNGLGVYKWNNNLSSAVADFVPYPAAVVNSKIISINKYEEDLSIIDRFYANQMGQNDQYAYNEQEIKQETLNVLIENEIIKQVSKKYQITVSEEEVQDSFNKIAAQVGSVDELKNEISTVYGISEETFIDKSLKPNLLFTKLHEKYVEDDNIDSERKEPNRQAASKAQEVLAKIENGENFEDLAKEQSDDTYSAELGGDLGYFGKGEMEPSFEEAAFALEKGEVSNLVRTRYGYHIIRVDDKKTTEQGEEQVTARHILFMAEDFFNEWLSDLKEGSKIHVLIKGFKWDGGEIKAE